MANRKASIWLYKKIDGRWRYVKPAIGRNGKIKPDPDAAYYLRYREGGKMVWRKCSSAAAATLAREKQEAYTHSWDDCIAIAKKAKVGSPFCELVCQINQHMPPDTIPRFRLHR